MQLLRAVWAKITRPKPVEVPITDPLKLHDISVIDIEFTAKIVTNQRMSGLLPLDVHDYIETAAVRAVERAIHELRNGEKPLIELGFD